MKENINENLIRKKGIRSKAKDTIFGVIQEDTFCDTAVCHLITPLPHRHVNKTGETPYHCKKKKKHYECQVNSNKQKKSFDVRK
jgi:hypothetical protein